MCVCMYVAMYVCSLKDMSDDIAGYVQSKNSIYKDIMNSCLEWCGHMAV